MLTRPKPVWVATVTPISGDEVLMAKELYNPQRSDSDTRLGGDGCAAGSEHDDRTDDLAQIMRAYNEVTQKLQASHESLKSQVVRLQSELVSTNAKLQRSKRLAALGEMAAGIAHEIRNPLGAIHLYAGMLVEDLEPDRAPIHDTGQMQETAVKIASAVRGLNAIVEDVLSFARELSPSPQLVEVGRLFDRAVEACAPILGAVEVAVCRADRQSDADDLRVEADPTLLHQTLLNLIRNAVDAMSETASPGGEGDGVRGEGGSEGRRQGRGSQEAGGESAGRVLTLDAYSEGGQVVMIVRDSGPGIAEADIDRIFNPFFTTRNTGTGLGLAIVHRIIDAHSGAISVHNDGGAVFSLSLPGAIAPGVLDHDVLDQAAASDLASAGPLQGCGVAVRG